MTRFTMNHLSHKNWYSQHTYAVSIVIPSTGMMQIIKILEYINPLYTNEFFLLVWNNKIEIVHCTYLGVSGYNFNKNFVFFCLPFFFTLTVSTLMKCCIMWHFIWVFTVCNSTLLGVSRIQSVKKINYLYHPPVAEFLYLQFHINNYWICNNIQILK